jgi:hypothetical protein
MTATNLGGDSLGDYSTSIYCPAAAIHGRAHACGASPLPPLSCIGRAGTGGVESAEFYLLRPGYQPFVVVDRSASVQPVPVSPYANLMAEVKSGFGRTMSRLPEVFGVSRQTLYNWIDGNPPKAAYHQRIEQLAGASKVFRDLNFKPTTTMLDRTVSNGKSFLQLLSEGADGKEAAMKLMRIVKRGADSRVKLETLLVGWKSTPSAADFGTPSFKEEA